MAISPSTDLRIIKCPLEIDEKNQITFANKTAQETYFLSLPYIEIDNISYQRKDSTIRFPGHIDSIMEYTYCMYKNDNYSNKWFYAFITKMEYINDNMTLITIKTDTYQTWAFDLAWKQCFVEREHVNNDSVGANTIPENLETGEYICNDHIKDQTMSSYTSNLKFILASTTEPNAAAPQESVSPSSVYNGIYTGLSYYRFDSASAIDQILNAMASAGKTDSINGIFMAPEWLAPFKSGSAWNEVAQSNTPATFDITISKQTTLNGYSPKNNKLKCFPYNYLLASNNIGQNTILHYEKFSGSSATFTVKGVLNPGCSINLTPTNYNGNVSADNDAIQLGKIPICNYQNDMYTNWLTQNSINILGNTVTTDDLNIASNAIGAGVGTITNLAVGNFAGAGMSIAGGFTGISNALIQQKQHNMISPTVSGQLNSADVNCASGNNTFHFYKMTIKQEYARIIDNFFSAYGYRVNSYKLPNLTGRTYWNYIKTIGCNITADIPQEDLQEIKDMFDNGITLWHDTSKFLDYSQNNTIVS